MFPELKEKAKTRLERIFSLEPNIDAIKKMLKRKKSREKNEDKKDEKS